MPSPPTASVSRDPRPAAPPRPTLTPARAWLIALVLAFVAACAAGTLGVTQTPEGGPGIGAYAAAVVFAGVGGGSLAALYALAGAGLGSGLVRMLHPVGKVSRELEFLAGLGVMLVVSHLLGWLGVLTPVTAWGAVIVGVALWAASFARPDPASLQTRSTAALWWLAALPAVGVMLAAASSPPGWLWTSEASGYDTLSYHLELVREWLAARRVSPLEHNIYSYLPSYGESAFLHLAHMALPVRSLLGEAASASVGGLAETAILGAAWLHAIVTLGGAIGLARGAMILLEGGGRGPDRSREFGVLAGAALLATPWVVVVGSLAYNDMFVVALGVGCVLGAITPGLSSSARGVLIGLMGSAAVGAKPTAFFFLAPLVLAALITPRLLASRADWARFTAACAVVGVVAGAPWLVRNGVASGNPVFPFGAGVFGDGPWTPGQHARHKAAHRFDGTVADRFTAAFALPTTTGANPATHGLGGQPRGVFHNQWSILFPVGIIGLGLGLATPGTRRASVAMLAALALQLGAWLALTHVQSRFLLPCAVPLGLGVALGLESLLTLVGGTRASGTMRTGVLVVGAACVGWLSVRSVLIFRAEHAGRPNAVLPFGVEGLSGESLIHRMSHVPPEMRQRAFADLGTAEMFVNAGGLDEYLPSEGSAALYLFGDANAFYFTNPRVPTIYHTTFDRPPWREAVNGGSAGGAGDAASAGDPDAWARALWARNVRFVLVNTSELARLMRSGWYDPAVTPELVNRFVRDHTRSIASWPHRGQTLYLLNPPETPTR